MTIKAGGKTFKTKTTLTNHCKFILNNAEINSILEGEWFNVIDDVLKMHEGYFEKIGGQAYQIGVRKCLINPRNRQFFILRADGTNTDFSYYKAITAKGKAAHIKETLRASIREQVVEYKEKFFLENQDNLGYIRCAETDLKVKKKDSHIDHYPKQFDEIVGDWVKIIGLSSDDIVLTRPPEDNATFWEMEDKALLESFQDLHREVATYRIVLNKVNQQRKRGKRFDF